MAKTVDDRPKWTCDQSSKRLTQPSGLATEKADEGPEKQSTSGQRGGRLTKEVGNRPKKWARGQVGETSSHLCNLSLVTSGLESRGATSRMTRKGLIGG